MFTTKPLLSLSHHFPYSSNQCCGSVSSGQRSQGPQEAEHHKKGSGVPESMPECRQATSIGRRLGESQEGCKIDFPSCMPSFTSSPSRKGGVGMKRKYLRIEHIHTSKFTTGANVQAHLVPLQPTLATVCQSTALLPLPVIHEAEGRRPATRSKRRGAKSPSPESRWDIVSGLWYILPLLPIIHTVSRPQSDLSSAG